MPTSSLRVCSFESRRREEMAKLIEKHGGIPTVAPSMREIPLEDNTAAFELAEKLLAGQIDSMVFMTGVGTDALFNVLATRNLAESVREALEGCLVVARGPKPVAVLNRLNIRIDLKAPEPNTWEQVVQTLEAAQVQLQGKRVAVQEYGEPSIGFYDWLEKQGAQVLRVPVYLWDLPQDVTELEHAIQGTIDSKFDVLLWTSAQQVNHAVIVAERLGLKDSWIAAANKCVIGSIGPTCSERLRSFGLEPTLEPSHPKMAPLVRETLDRVASNPQRHG